MSKGLDEAWAEAEAALPEGWVIWGFNRATRNDTPDNDEVMVWAGHWRPDVPAMPKRGVGRTLPDALHALAVRLRRLTEPDLNRSLGSEIGSRTPESTLTTHEKHNTAGIGTGVDERA